MQRLYWEVAQGLSARRAADKLDMHLRQALRILRARDYAYGELPIISQDVWSQVQRALDERDPHKP